MLVNDRVYLFVDLFYPIFYFVEEKETRESLVPSYYKPPDTTDGRAVIWIWVNE